MFKVGDYVAHYKEGVCEVINVGKLEMSCSDREKECIAFTFLAQGFCAFALEYSVSPVHYPAQLIEGCMAMAYIRENAAEFRIDENHVSVVGFSA